MVVARGQLGLGRGVGVGGPTECAAVSDEITILRVPPDTSEARACQQKRGKKIGKQEKYTSNKIHRGAAGAIDSEHESRVTRTP